ncbi:hypothetical protein GOP47_0022126 [Adiantum capillus-veneris]|uniref:Pentatricopeptide repeat-containing protein n=1 Tax=Adiantum capillus-veneris TaxID=13818 RepID=A0A9D4Z6U1_ADICA|nr:hypothetical protein GOP47_0022126 [Adiantum capillus-veneris]
MMLGSHCAGCTSPFSPSPSPLTSSSSSASPVHFHSLQHTLTSQICRNDLNRQSSALRNLSDEPFSESLREGNLHASQHDIQTYLSLVRECCESGALEEGKLLHRCIVDNGHGQNRLLANTLIHMYGRCGAFAHAVDVFTHLSEKNVYSWTIMLSACIDCGKFEDALEIFEQMPERNLVGWNLIILACVKHGLISQARKYYQSLLQECTPNKMTFLNILPVCNDTEQLNRIHGQIAKSGLDCDTTIANSLLNMYNKCGNFKKAEQIFKKVPHRDICTWNTMISAFAQHGQGNDSLHLFIQMQKEGIVPDVITYIGLIEACSGCLDSCSGVEIHKLVVSDGFESDLIVGTALVNMYGKFSNLKAANRSFNRMFKRDLVAWNALMDAYAQHGQFAGAHELLTQMQYEGFPPDIVTLVSLLSSCTSPESLDTGRQVHKCIQLLGLEVDVSIGNSLLHMYGKCGSFDEAFMVFSQMINRNVISWNAMINVCTQCGQEKMALEFFQDMIQQEFVPDGVTLLGVIDACANQAILSEAKHIHSYIERFGLVLDAMIRSAVIKMYSKCGSLEDVQRVFDESPVKDVILWNTIISSYAQHGHGERALEIFEQMKVHGVKPNESTLSIVLSACSHAGLASRGGQYFLEIGQDYGVTPTMEHFNFLIDLLGRSGQISDVENLIERMPMEPNATSWMTFLSACMKHLDIQAEKSVADRVLEYDS